MYCLKRNTLVCKKQESEVIFLNFFKTTFLSEPLTAFEIRNAYISKTRILGVTKKGDGWSLLKGVWKLWPEDERGGFLGILFLEKCTSTPSCQGWEWAFSRWIYNHYICHLLPFQREDLKGSISNSTYVLRERLRFQPDLWFSSRGNSVPQPQDILGNNQRHLLVTSGEGRWLQASP